MAAFHPSNLHAGGGFAPFGVKGILEGPAARRGGWAADLIVYWSGGKTNAKAFNAVALPGAALVERGTTPWRRRRLMPISVSNWSKDRSVAAIAGALRGVRA